MVAGFRAETFTDSRGYTLRYRMLLPARREERSGVDPERLPLVLLLHGAGERGDDNRSQLANGAMDLLASETAMARFPCFAVLPQCPADQRWVDVDWGAARHVLSPQPSASLAATLELLDSLLDRHHLIDPQRLYLIGLSMGAFGVWDLLSRFPQRFAAAAAICGGGDEDAVVAARAVPIWAFHGARDPEVPVERSRRAIAALRAVGGTPRYTEYADVGHDAWTHAFAEPKLLHWLFAQRR